MYEKLELLRFTILDETEEVQALAAEYVNNGVLTQNSYDDCLHIAQAVIGKCDYLVSWNYRHIVRPKTVQTVKMVNLIGRYNEISICTPEMLVWEEP